MTSNLYTHYAKKLKNIIRKNISRNSETAMAAIAAYAKLSYEWNQFYTDEEIESDICRLSDKLLPYSSEAFKPEKDTVLFYDGFGLDTRGLAANYAKALISLGYKVVWVTTVQSKGKIPTIEGFLKSGNSELVFIDMKRSYHQHIEQLNEQFQKYRPSKAFFYTTPDDVSGEVVFYRYRNIVKRFQINLTDHAYWIGLNAFDYCVEFRDYGAGISRVQRKIPKEKIVVLPFYPLIDKPVEFQGFPFDATGKKILFSGGALYKTIGGDNQYYKIVENVLKANEDTIFLYAGFGDDSQIQILESQFPGRVYLIKERKDLFALMEHIDVYLNTFPMVGGLMMQYAAIAGKPPITLLDKENTDASGILLNQDSIGIEFLAVKDAVCEINHLLQDDTYRSKRAGEIMKCVPSPEDFTKNLADIIEEKANYDYAECPDTEKLRREYVDRFNIYQVEDSIGRIKNKKLFMSFPVLFLDKIRRKILHR